MGSCACAPERPPMVRLPFTRSYVATGLSTQSTQVARFFEPEGVLPTSAIRRCTGIPPRCGVGFLVLRKEGTTSSRLRHRPAPRPWNGVELNGLTSRAGCASEDARPAWTGPTRVKVRAVVSAGESPPRTGSAHLFRRVGSATRGGTARAFCRHPVVLLRANAGQATF
jgi:hypothetical protein